MTPSTTHRIVAALAFAALFSVGSIGDASAQETAAPNYVSGSRPTGAGGAFNAVGTGPPGMYHNPAGIATARMYAFGGTYEYTPTGNVLNGTIVDSKTNPKLAAAAGYSYHIGHDQTEDPQGHDIRLALSVPALPDRVSIGVGGRFLILEQNDTELARGFTLDAGVLFKIADNVHLGVVGSNLIDVCRQPQRCRGVTPRTLGGGFSYGQSTNFRLNGDISVDFNSEADPETGDNRINFLAEGGGEYLIGGSVPVRLGYRHRTLDTSNHVTGGLGWRASQFGLDAGVDVNINDPSALTVSTAFAVYFN